MPCHICPRLPRVLRFRLASLIVLALMALAAPPQAEAAKRVALVIGNDAYENVPKLLKARNDAKAMADALTRIGFDVVSAEDVGRRAMSRALVEFEQKIEAGDTALLFFAGHGLDRKSVV